MIHKYLQVTKSYPEYFGVKRFCNVCGFRFAKFAPAGVITRETLCPVCGSLERHRHLFIHLMSLLPFLKNRRVLHFAPEAIIRQFFINSDAEYFDADIVKGRATYQVDITDINIENAFFDYCLAIHVLEHVVEDSKAFSELYRVLKPGGLAIISVPTQAEAFEDYSIVSEEARLKAFGLKDHVRTYSQSLFEERIQAAGFSVQRSEASHFPPEMREACVLGDKIVFARK